MYSKSMTSSLLQGEPAELTYDSFWSQALKQTSQYLESCMNPTFVA